MKRISIRDLRAQLSAAVLEAESGHIITITRYNEPVAELGPARSRYVYQGTRVGAGQITPALRRATRGRYLTVLMEERGNR